MRGEIDARSEVSLSILKRHPDCVEKRMANLHAVIEIRKEKRSISLRNFSISRHLRKPKRSAASSLCSGCCAAWAHPTSSVQGYRKIDRKFFRQHFARPMTIPTLKKNTKKPSAV